MICSVPVAPMRKEPAHKSEMTSQLLFGEKVIFIESAADGWQKVRGKFDHYEGWIQKGQLIIIDEHKFNKTDTLVTGDWLNEIDFNGYKMCIPMGCSLSAFGSGITPWSKNTVRFKGNQWNIEEAGLSDKLLKQTTYKFLNTTYLWGGKSVFGIDCSGFVQTILKLFNVKVPRDAWQQAETGDTVDFLESARCGDIAYFDNDEGRIVHTGIILNPNEIIHASGKVRLDKIDNQGIINQETNERTHQLRIIKRYF